MEKKSSVGEEFLATIRKEAAQIKKTIELINAVALEQLVMRYDDLRDEQYTLVLGKDAWRSEYHSIVEILTKRACQTIDFSELQKDKRKFSSLGYTIFTGFSPKDKLERIIFIEAAGVMTDMGMIVEILCVLDKKRTAYTPFGEVELPWEKLGLPGSDGE
jgi:hypothetical protein